MAYEVRLPEFGHAVTEAKVARWQHEEGDAVEEGDVLVEIATDNEIVHIPLQFRGIVKEIVADEQDIVRVGDLLAIIDILEDK